MVAGIEEPAAEVESGITAIGKCRVSAPGYTEILREFSRPLGIVEEEGFLENLRIIECGRRGGW
jgi:hypothetical protein